MLKNRLRFTLFLLLAQVVLALAGACGARAPQDNVALIYPPPPDEPRIVYLKSYRGEGDFIKPGFWDLIFGTVGSSTLSKPYGVFASEGRIYVTLTGSGGVIMIDTRNRKVDYLGSRFTLPMGLTGTRDGMIFVSDATQKKVFGYDGKGNLGVAIGKKGEFANPAGLAVNDELKRLYVVDSFNQGCGSIPRAATPCSSSAGTGQGTESSITPRTWQWTGGMAPCTSWTPRTSGYRPLTRTAGSSESSG